MNCSFTRGSIPRSHSADGVASRKISLHPSAASRWSNASISLHFTTPRPHAVSQVQRIDHHKAPRTRMFLHAGMKPFHRAYDALQMPHIVLNRESLVLADCQGPVSMRLRQMNQASNLPRAGGSNMSSDEPVDQRRLSHAGRSLDQQCLEWRLHHAPLPVAIAQAAAV